MWTVEVQNLYVLKVFKRNNASLSPKIYPSKSRILLFRSSAIRCHSLVVTTAQLIASDTCNQYKFL